MSLTIIFVKCDIRVFVFHYLNVFSYVTKSNKIEYDIICYNIKGVNLNKVASKYHISSFGGWTGSDKKIFWKQTTVEALEQNIAENNVCFMHFQTK